MRWRWAAAALGGLAVAIAAGDYIQGKRQLAKVQALPLPPTTVGAGLLVIGDSRVAQWPADLIPDRGVAVGFPGAAAISIAAVAPQIYARTRPRRVVIQAGFNDASAAAFAFGKEREAIVEAAAKAVTRMAIDARTAGAHDVVILTVAPAIQPELSRRLLYGGRHDAAVSAMNQQLGKIDVDGVTILDVEPFLRGTTGRLDPLYKTDSAHWSAAAYRRISQALVEVLDARSMD
ncbi:SGNH/GDSL hydrolase family protein [Sphingomonas tabacisoli]|uniref:SGNH/GDSL hydrolase family protein n=1 Tax=Sphingomonas tabacisoli TaxID=2249466 RepID=A0ABW4HXF2_9SPHN